MRSNYKSNERCAVTRGFCDDNKPWGNATFAAIRGRLRSVFVDCGEKQMEVPTSGRGSISEQYSFRSWFSALEFRDVPGSFVLCPDSWFQKKIV